jgi:Holliday junction DNA helicase RuvA
VQGVGAKMAMRILGFFSVEQLAGALIAGDIKSFSKVSGVGPKLAHRITTELRESPKKLGVDVGFVAARDGDGQNIGEFVDNQIATDALSALENLGYKKSDALKIIAITIEGNKSITLENLITACLRELSKNKF